MFTRNVCSLSARRSVSHCNNTKARLVHSDVTIIGGGIMGSSLAYHLADAHAKLNIKSNIRVIEKDSSYAKASTALSVGGIRQQFSTPENILVGQYGYEFTQNIEKHLSVGDWVPNVNWTPGPYLYLASEKGIPILQSNHEAQIKLGVPAKLIPHEKLAEVFPWMNPEGIACASVTTEGEGWVDPFSLLIAFKKKAQSLGVEYINDEVVDMKTNDKSIKSVHLKAGNEITCSENSAVVNCAGVFSTHLMNMIGLKYPVEHRKRYVYIFDSGKPLPSHLVIDPSGIYWRNEGKYFIAGLTPPDDAACDPEDFEVDHSLFEELVWPHLANRVPSFESVKLMNAWAGHYDYNAFDYNAIVGKHPDVSNLFLLNGFSGHGLQQSPAMGRGLTELMVHDKYQTLDLSCFSVERWFQNKQLLESNII
eukprot:TRINITY_DN4849_c0_g1_i1.p1 TRINITY_DN4849_c0_g1~~TRINITY_DN4849_c0_g1_i1.p1  ORF type:complete len:421 (+),score=63.08 TRINITY_DN4849_c0_g1_i1:10-1272(+)